MRLSLLLLVGIVALAGCNSTEPVKKFGIAPLTVDFAWKPSDRCSTISPAIHLRDFPADTSYFDVRLRDRDDSKLMLGGGNVANDGSGVLPEGALKNGYTGPCPASGTHNYYFDVRAIDKSGTAIARGTSPERPFP